MKQLHKALTEYLASRGYKLDEKADASLIIPVDDDGGTLMIPTLLLAKSNEGV